MKWVTCFLPSASHPRCLQGCLKNQLDAWHLRKCQCLRFLAWVRVPLTCTRGHRSPTCRQCTPRWASRTAGSTLLISRWSSTRPTPTPHRSTRAESATRRSTTMIKRFSARVVAISGFIGRALDWPTWHTWCWLKRSTQSGSVTSVLPLGIFRSLRWNLSWILLRNVHVKQFPILGTKIIDVATSVCRGYWRDLAGEALSAVSLENLCHWHCASALHRLLWTLICTFNQSFAV